MGNIRYGNIVERDASRMVEHDARKHDDLTQLAPSQLRDDIRAHQQAGHRNRLTQAFVADGSTSNCTPLNRANSSAAPRSIGANNSPVCQRRL